MQFCFHPSGIAARRSTDQNGLSKHKKAKLIEMGRGSPLSGTARPVDGQGGT